MNALLALLIFPCGLFILFNGLVYEWIDRRLMARMQNRIGPRWFQPFADMVKLMLKEDLIPPNVNRMMFNALPLVALAGVLTAGLTLPIAGFAPVMSFSGDLIVTVYLLSLLTICIGLAGANSGNHYAMMGSTRLFTQLFAYEVPFLLALLSPALVTGSWQISEIIALQGGDWLWLHPVSFVIAILSLMGKLELPPFDAPEAETEIVAGTLTEYSGRGLALFMLAKKAALVIGLTLIASLYLGGIANPLDYLVKTVALLALMTLIHTLLARFRIDQTLGLWWRVGMLLMLAQWFVLMVIS